MNQFLTLSYYFTPKPVSDFQFTKFTLGICLALLILGIVFEVYRKRGMTDKVARKILKPYPQKLIRYGVVALFLLAFREAGIPYLSMRVWWFVLAAFMIYSALKLAFTYKKQYRIRTETQKTIVKKDDKYLPKKKK